MEPPANPGRFKPFLGHSPVPAREVSTIDGLTGAHIEAFFNDLTRQTVDLGANLVLPSGDHPAHHASEEGLEFVGEAYACPEGQQWQTP